MEMEIEIESDIKKCYTEVTRGAAEVDRKESLISDVRTSNNFVKALLFSQFVPRHLPVKIFDWACGKGGDYFKLERFFPSMEQYVGMDITPASIEQFRERVGAKPVHIQVQDLTNPEFPPSFREAFYTVSCQFAFHYFFNDPHSVLDNMSWLLAPGGIVILTVPNEKEIKRRLVRRADNQFEYRVIDFASGELKCRIVQVAEFPRGYLFELFDGPDKPAVCAPEYFVNFDTLQQAADIHGMSVKFRCGLLDYFKRNLTNAYLVEQFKVQTRLSSTDEAILSLYDCIVLEKRNVIQMAPVIHFL